MQPGTEVTRRLTPNGSGGAELTLARRGLWAVGVRTQDDYNWVGPALDRYVKQGLLTFESVQQDDQPTIGDAV